MVCTVLVLMAIPAAGRAQAAAEIQVTPETLTIGVGRKQTLFAAVFDRQGNVLPTVRVTYASSDTTIVRVADDGTVVGLRAGLARIEARAQERRAAVAVFVTESGAPPVSARDTTSTSTAASAVAAALKLDPPTLTLMPGEPGRFTVSALGSDGSPVGAVSLVWKSLRPSVATVASDGTILGVAAGDAVVQASARGGLAATASVTVAPADFTVSPITYARPPDALDTLRATVPAQNGRVIQGGLTWYSTDSAVARVGPTGIVQTLVAGETDIVATGFGQERRAHVAVFPKPEILLLAPRPSTGPVQVPIGAAVNVSARALAADSTPIPQAPISWELADTSIAALDVSTGHITGRHAGTTSLTARLPGFEPAVWVINVVAGDIALDRRRLGLAAGMTGALTAHLVDTLGAAQGTPTALTWVSDHAEVVSPGVDGALTAIAPGRATITARAPWGKTASADVFVTGDLLLSSDRGGRGFGIYQLSLTAPDSLIPILADSAVNVQSVWSLDRTSIAFSSNRAGNFDLYVMDADGRNVHRITSDPGADGEPAWTPDGARVVFSGVRAAATQIYSVAADSTDLRQLTTSVGGNISPAVSPDGATIAFVSARDGNYEVYLMDADGGNQRRVTNTPEREAAPHFFPNRDLAYIVDRGPKGGSAIVRQTPGTAATTTLAESPATIVSFALSRDGSRLVYVTGRLGSNARSEFALFLQPATPRATPAVFRLRPAEQPVTPAF